MAKKDEEREPPMPFPQQTARFFTTLGVGSVPDNLRGVYGLFRDQGPWIYVGKGEIKNRLQDHLRGDIPCIIQNGATHFYIEEGSSLIREKELIRELKPLCNERIG